VDTRAAAAGLGRVAEARTLFPGADAEDRRRALAWPRSRVTSRSCACCSMPERIRTATTRKATTRTPPPSPGRLVGP
jgi:hypothetical protein